MNIDLRYAAWPARPAVTCTALVRLVSVFSRALLAACGGSGGSGPQPLVAPPSAPAPLPIPVPAPTPTPPPPPALIRSAALASLTLANGYDVVRNDLTTTESLLELAATALEVDLEASWTGHLHGADISLGAAQAFNAGHIAGQRSSAAWLRAAARF